MKKRTRAAWQRTVAVAASGTLLIVAASAGLAAEPAAGEPARSGFVPADTITTPMLAAFSITGASMGPALPQGSLTIVEMVDPQQLGVGDVVTVPLVGSVVTRRVVGTDAIDSGRLLTLQADASPNPDPVGVLYAGKALVVRGHVPYAGYLAALALEHGRTIAGILGLALIVIAIAARPRMRTAPHRRRTMAAAA